MTPVDGELTCRELVELVTDYLEGALGPTDRARFEQHLTYCEPCSNYMDQMRHTLEVVGALGEESLSEPAKEKLLAAFRHWNRASRGEAGDGDD